MHRRDHAERLVILRTGAAASEKVVRRALDLDGPVAAVPSWRGWSVTDLLRRVGGVHRYLAHVLRGRLTVPPDPAGLTLPDLSDGPDAVIDWFADGAGEPGELFHELGPDTTARTWSAEQTSGFWLRMRLIEPAVHRWDAESATGTPAGLAPDLAADGVPRTIEVMAPARPGGAAAGTAGSGGDVPLPAYGRPEILDGPPRAGPDPAGARSHRPGGGRRGRGQRL
ncbi:maleylpyruvate isomerase family mycothiol-dependent enzyme [Streptomyces sp. NPDC054945]